MEKPKEKIYLSGSETLRLDSNICSNSLNNCIAYKNKVSLSQILYAVERAKEKHPELEEEDFFLTEDLGFSQTYYVGNLYYRKEIDNPAYKAQLQACITSLDLERKSLQELLDNESNK